MRHCRAGGNLKAFVFHSVDDLSTDVEKSSLRGGTTACRDFLGKQSFLLAILVRKIASSAEKAFSQ